MGSGIDEKLNCVGRCLTKMANAIGLQPNLEYTHARGS